MTRALRVSLGLITGSLLMAMMLLTAADVGGRYFFNSPVEGAQELTEMLLATSMFSALPLVTLGREHVTVSLFDHFFTGTAGLVRSIIIDVLSLVVLVAFGWRLILLGQMLAEYGDQTLFLNLPLAPIAWFMAAMSFASALLVALMLVDLVRRGDSGLRKPEVKIL